MFRQFLVSCALLTFCAILPAQERVGGVPVVPGSPLETKKSEAEQAYRQGQYDEAIRLTTEVLRSKASDHVALYLRASARVEKGQVSNDVAEVRSGIEDAREALRYGGIENALYYLPYLHGMAALARMENRPEHADAAIKVATDVLERANLKRDDQANLRFQRAAALVSRGKFDEAVTDYSEAIRLNPEHLGAYVGRAEAYLASNRDDQAKTAFDEAVSKFPDNPLVLNNRGMFLQRSGDLEGAVSDFTRVLEVDPSYQVAYTNRGFSLLEQGNPLAAEADFSKALEMLPNQPVVHSLRATSRLAQGQLEPAVADYQEVIRLDPKNPIAHADLGFAFYFGENYAGALNEFERARAGNDDLIFLDPWIYWSLVNTNRRADADKRFAAAMKAAADKQSWITHLLLYLSGQTDDQVLLSKVSQQAEDIRQAQSCEAYFFMGERAAKAGQGDVAERHYRAALATGVTHLSAYRGAQYALNEFPGATTAGN